MNSPKEVAQNYIALGAAKTTYSIGRMFWLGVLAGMFIALAGTTSTISSATLTGSAARIAAAVVFPGGLAMVLIAGSELFTGNTMILISVLEKQATWGGMLKNWLVVYIGNLAGSVLIAALVVFGHTFAKIVPDGMAGVMAIHTAVAKVNMTFLDAFYRGILCNFLVCIAVWMSLAAKDAGGKIIALFFPIMFFVLNGWEHSVANMYYISAGLFASGTGAFTDAVAKAFPGDRLDTLTWGAFFVKNQLPVTLGNIAGGAVLVALIYWFVYLRADKKSGAPSGGK
ncbi:formate/nitrite transporter [Sporobacter termitidis DSM 10068]|uniref:Formate/nitrite transporter n=1 Tax=Sporobacter termitidis DSM 10068 TaxID=1123282 RepID=A0A1M5YX75_9FIRM|nr:formate/nitrite transporter family protein [Sporobacter termitidis]SHI16565.1 formate/nitrite transporter [Sporobacter termitidis DSM 10068]